MAARKPDIQYVTQFYVYGSEARVLELKPERRKSRTILPKAAPNSNKEILVKLDPKMQWQKQPRAAPVLPASLCVSAARSLR